MKKKKKVKKKLISKEILTLKFGKQKKDKTVPQS